MGAVCAIAVSACDTPSAEFRDLPAQVVTVEQSVFEVRRSGTTVELLGTNTEYAPTFASIIPRATRAVAMATGCTARPNSWEGEQTLMQVEVDCPDS
jgi:hypothetical protein